MADIIGIDQREAEISREAGFPGAWIVDEGYEITDGILKPSGKHRKLDAPMAHRKLPSEISKLKENDDSLRHSHTSLLAEAEVSLPQIMERLGHKDESTTENVYLHVTKQMKKEASQKFKELMENL